MTLLVWQNLSTVHRERTSVYMDRSAAFDELKSRLISAPILPYPNFNDTFVCDTDANDIGVCAVLSQRSEGEE